MNKYKLYDLPIHDQAYFIIVGLNGSWLYNAMYKWMEVEANCQSIVDNYKADWCQTTLDQIEQYVNESYDDIKAYKASKQ